MLTIEISKETLEAIKKLDNRYFFNLFSEICTTVEDEYLFRNAINEIAHATQNKTKEKTK